LRDINEVLRDNRIKMVWRNTQNDKAIQVKVDVKLNSRRTHKALVKFTRAMGWEHLSASYQDRIATWEEMSELKDMFWNKDECAFQYHPKEEDYINNNPRTLHIWRPLDFEVITPPTLFIGFRKGHEEEDREMLKQIQIELGNPLTDAQIDAYVSTVGTKEDMQKAVNNLSLEETIKMLF